MYAPTTEIYPLPHHDAVRICVGVRALVPLEHLLGLDAEAPQLVGRLGQPRAALLVAPLAEVAQQAEPDRLLEQPRAALVAPEAIGQLAQVDDLGLLVLERLAHRAGELEEVAGVTGRRVDELADRLEVEPVGLELLDE